VGVEHAGSISWWAVSAVEYEGTTCKFVKILRTFSRVAAEPSEAKAARLGFGRGAQLKGFSCGTKP